MSEYTPASWNTGLYLNELKNEIYEIGEYVGFFWELLPSNNNVVISGSSNNYSVTIPNGNSTSYAYSNLKRNEPWSCSCEISPNTYMCMGISTDLSNNFSNPSSESMKMLNYGLIVDTQGADGLWQVVNGVLTGFPITYSKGDIIKIDYDGITLKYYINHSEVFTPITTAIDPVYLVISSYYGGSVNSINFSGSGGSSGSKQNLEETLTIGNNGGNLDITNIGNLSINKYLNIGNEVGNSSQIHMNWDSSPSNSNVQLVALGQSGSSVLLVQSYENNTFQENMMTLREDLALFPNEVSASSFSITDSGPVLDISNNPPNYYFNSNLTSGVTTKNIPSNSPISILQFDLQNSNYSYYNCNLSTLIFTLDILGASPSDNITARFFLSSDKDADYINNSLTPLNTSYTTGNLNSFNGGQPNFNLPSNAILSTLETSNKRILYLNIKISCSISTTFNLSNFNIQLFGQASPATLNNVTPSLVS